MPGWLTEIVLLLLRPSNLIAFLLLAGLALLVLNRRGGFALITAGTAAYVLCGFFPLGEVLLYPLEQRFPFRGYVIAEPDGIIMLGGALEPKIVAGRHVAALNEAADRVVVLAELANRYPLSRIIVSGGPARSPGGVRLGAPVVASLLEEFGIDRDRIVLEPESRNTWQNATFTKQVVDPEPGQRWIVVTSAWHMPRAIGAFRAAGWTGLEAWPVDYRTAGPPRLVLSAASAQGLQTTNLAVREWLALFGYWLAGRSDALFPAPTKG